MREIIKGYKFINEIINIFSSKIYLTTKIDDEK